MAANWRGNILACHTKIKMSRTAPRERKQGSERGKMIQYW